MDKNQNFTKKNTTPLQTVDLLHLGHDNAPDAGANSLFSNVCKRLSLDIVEICKTAGSGHLGGSLSSVELMSTLYFGGHLKFSLDDPQHPQRDRVLVRGHLGPLRYPLFSLLDWVQEKEFKSYRRLGSRLHGHESMLDLPGVDITPSGSLGMLLSYGVGASLVSQNRDHLFRTYVFLGDGEEQEGNISEAARHAANMKLSNLVCVLDQNGKQLSRATSDLNKSSDIKSIWQGYGWNVIEVKDGHDPLEISNAYTQSRLHHDAPTMIIAKTIKGRGLDGAEEHWCGYHTIGSCKAEVVDSYISTVKASSDPEALSRPALKTAVFDHARNVPNISPLKKPAETAFPSVDLAQIGDFNDAMTFYYSNLIDKLQDQNRNDFYFLTADMMPKIMIPRAGVDRLQNFYDVGLREQHMFAMAHGISVCDPDARVHIHAGDAFAYRALDQLNSAGQGKSKIMILADSPGFANSRNGSTHQSVSQSFAMNSQPNTIFLEPSDSEDFYACLNYTLNKNDSIYYIRCHSMKADILPKSGFNPEDINSYYEVGDHTDNPDITLIGSGITTSYLWRSLEKIKANNITARLINITAPSKLTVDFAKLVAKDKPCLCVYNGHPDFLPSIVSPHLLNSKDGRPSSIIGKGFTLGSTGTTDELVEHFGFNIEALTKDVVTICNKNNNLPRIQPNTT